MNIAYRPLQRTPRVRSEFDRMLGAVDSKSAQYEWSPTVEILQTETGYRIELDVPGVSADAIDISIEKSELTISGDRSVATDKTDSEIKVLRSERLSGKFKRRFSLSDDVDAESIVANYEAGVLSIELARKEAVLPRKIEVKANG